MGLMKLATYYRSKKKYDVRFFKGDLKNFAATLLAEELLDTFNDAKLKKQTPDIISVCL